MSGHGSWAGVKRRVREAHPEVSDAQWEARKQAARTATEAHVLGHHLREIHNLETIRTYAAALGARITVSIEYGDRTIGAA